MTPFLHKIGKEQRFKHEIEKIKKCKKTKIKNGKKTKIKNTEIQK